MKQMARRSMVFCLTLLLGIVVSLGVRVEATSAQTWGKLFHSPWTAWDSGTTINSFILTSDGGYAAVGTSYGYGVVVKLDANGSMEWSRIFNTGGYRGATQFTSIVETQDFGYAVAGYANVTFGIGDWDVYVVRFNSDGSVRWESLYGRVTNPGQEHPTWEFAQRIYENDDETLTVTGTIAYSHMGECIYHGYESGLVLNLDSDGGIISKYVLAGSFLGGPGHQVYQTWDGGYLVSLVHSFPNLGSTVNLQKYGSNGGLVWTKAYYAKNGTTNELLGEGRVAEVSDGYIVTASVSASPSGRLYLFKIDFSGKVEWQKKFNIYNGGSTAHPHQVIEASDGGAIVSITSSYSTVDDVVLKTSVDGDLDWANLYGAGRYLATVQSSTDGGYVTAADGYNFVFAKLDGTGFLENPCAALPISTQPVVEETGSSTIQFDGYGPISCSGVLATGTWITVEVSLALSSVYSEVDACVPDLEIWSTVPVNFSSVKVGNTSSSKPVTVSNYNGLAYLLIGEVSLTDTLNFSIVSDNCSHQTAYPVNFGSPTSCDIQVVFNPKSKGLKTAHLLIPSNGTQGDVTLTGTGYLTQYTLTTSVSPVGTGSVGLDPSGGTYDEGTSVTVTPNAAPGYRFDHWTGGLTGSAHPGHITMDGNKSVTAVFVQQFTLTTSVSPAGGGSVGLAPPGGTYDAGTSVTVTPNAAPGYRFDHWTGGLTGSSHPGHITMDGNKSVTAVLVQQFTLTTSVSPAGGGSVGLAPPGETYDAGTLVTVTANAAPGYRFDHWTGDLTGSSHPGHITMDGNKSVTAVFIQQFTLTTLVSPSGGGSVGLAPPGGTYDAGTSVTVTPNAAPGYRFDHWTGDLTGSSHPDHMTMDGNKALTAVFVRQHTLNTKILPPGAGSVSPAGGLYDVGTSVPLRANAGTGYHFDHWSGDHTGKTNPSPITMDGDMSVTAVFLPDSGGPTVFETNPNIFGLGAMVTLSGAGFGTSKPTVMLGSLKPKVVSYKDDEIVFSLTKGLANTYPAKVIVKKVGTSNEVPCTLSAPVITGLDKTEGKQNDPVKISGKYFGIKKSKVQCVAGDGTVKSAKVVGYSDTQLDVLVPKVGVGTYQLKVQNAAGISSPVSFTVK